MTGDAAGELIEPETRGQGIVAMPPRVSWLPRVVVESASAQEAVGKLFAIAHALGNYW